MNYKIAATRDSAILSKVPLGCFSQADEIAKAVLFLASDESSYILGEKLLVDGRHGNHLI